MEDILIALQVCSQSSVQFQDGSGGESSLPEVVPVSQGGEIKCTISGRTVLAECVGIHFLRRDGQIGAGLVFYQHALTSG